MIVSTQWGVRSPWGDDAAKDKDTAQTIVKNMKSAGHDAEVVWRGVTPWITEGDADQ